jgi:glyoxylase-like metal-dependent hydrolase (beta-lactamase superfamily II)
VTDLRRGPDPWFVITGDTLFSGAVGRPDLPGAARENARQLYSSLHDKLMTLPDEVEVYPAHFGGSACGAGLSGKPSSTIGFERRFNKTLSLARDAFVDALGVTTPKPAEFDAVLEYNRGPASH